MQIRAPHFLKRLGNRAESVKEKGVEMEFLRMNENSNLMLMRRDDDEEKETIHFLFPLALP